MTRAKRSERESPLPDANHFRRLLEMFHGSSGELYFACRETIMNVYEDALKHGSRVADGTAETNVVTADTRLAMVDAEAISTSRSARFDTADEPFAELGQVNMPGGIS